MSLVEWLNSNHALISAVATVVIAVAAIVTEWASTNTRERKPTHA